MAGSQRTITNDGPIPAAWTTVGQSLQANAALGSATALQTSSLVLDQYQNAVLIIGALNQVVTAGAGWDTSLDDPYQALPGIQIGTGRSDFGIGVPSADPVFTSCTISSLEPPYEVVVASASGLEVGMQIGANGLGASESESTNVIAEAITPGTTITAIDGTTVTLSDAPLLIVTAADVAYLPNQLTYNCAAMATWDNLVGYFTAHVLT